MEPFAADVATLNVEDNHIALAARLGCSPSGENRQFTTTAQQQVADSSYWDDGTWLARMAHFSRCPWVSTGKGSCLCTYVYAHA